MTDEPKSGTVFGLKVTLPLIGGASLTATLPLGGLAFVVFTNPDRLGTVASTVSVLVFGIGSAILLGVGVATLAGSFRRWWTHDIERFRNLNYWVDQLRMDVDNVRNPQQGQNPNASLHRFAHLEVELEDLGVGGALPRGESGRRMAPDLNNLHALLLYTREGRLKEARKRWGNNQS